MEILAKLQTLALPFLKTYWIDLLIVAVGLTAGAYLWKQGKKKAVKKAILVMVIQAEKMLGSGTGELKYEVVVNWIYEKLPFLVRIVFSKQEIDEMIEEAVTKLENYLQGKEGQESKNLLGADKELQLSLGENYKGVTFETKF